MSEESFVYTACPGWGDHDYCALKTIVKDGKIVRTEKAVYTGPEKDSSHICQKGLLAARQPYNPDRLTAPLKRVGARGEGKWEKITWDQALDEIAEKMLKIREKHGPESVVFWSLPASVPPSQGLTTMLFYRFLGLWGGTDPVNGIGLDNGPVFSTFYTFGNASYYSTQDPKHFIGSDVLLVWGCNPIENQMLATMNLVRAREAGAHTVDIGLVFDGSAGWADEFIGVAPGSDTWFALAMAKHIIDCDLIDRDFLIHHSVAAYLVREDDGKFLRDADGNYMLWDPVAKAPFSVASPHAAARDEDAVTSSFVASTGVTAQIEKEPALLGSFTVDGVAVKTAYQKLVEFLEDYTPEAAEKFTKVPAADIRRLAEMYGKADKAYIMCNLGMRYANQGSAYRSVLLLGILTGNYGEPGKGVMAGGMYMSFPFVFNDMPIVMPNGPHGQRGKAVMLESFFNDATSDNSPYHGFLGINGNPVHNFPDRGRWLKALDQMDLVVDFDIWMTDTGELADYVLPDCMPFERSELLAFASYAHVVLQEPAIDPPEQVKNSTYLFSGLAQRVGLGEYFDKTTDEWLALRLDSPDPSIATIEPKLTLERLKKEKMVRANVPVELRHDPFRGLNFMTPSGRAEFYAENLADLGFALPKYTPCWESPVIDGNEKHPYQLFTGRQRFFMQSMFSDDPINVELSGGEPCARMNPVSAAEKGLHDGERVEIYNDRGHVVTKLELDESVPAGTIHVWYGWRRKHFEEGMYSEMIAPISSSDIVDDVARRFHENWLGYGGGIFYNALDGLSSEVGSWDAFWDAACNIRPYPAGKEA